MTCFTRRNLETLLLPVEIIQRQLDNLMSAQAMVGLVRLTSFMRSQHPAAVQFREAFLATPRAGAEPGAGDREPSGSADLGDPRGCEIDPQDACG